MSGCGTGKGLRTHLDSTCEPKYGAGLGLSPVAWISCKSSAGASAPTLAPADSLIADMSHPHSFLRGKIDCQQIGIDAHNDPFVEFTICEHAFQSEWVLLEIGHRFVSVYRVVNKKPSLIVREGTRQG